MQTVSLELGIALDGIIVGDATLYVSVGIGKDPRRIGFVAQIIKHVQKGLIVSVAWLGAREKPKAAGNLASQGRDIFDVKHSLDSWNLSGKELKMEKRYETGKETQNKTGQRGEGRRGKTFNFCIICMLSLGLSIFSDSLSLIFPIFVCFFPFHPSSQKTIRE